MDIIWKEISNLSVKNDKVIEGYSKIDAYVVNNDEVKAYVEAREANYRKAKDFLERCGYEADRSFFGSEDGEAILYRKKGTEDWKFLCHLDPLFVEIEDVEGYVKEEKAQDGISVLQDAGRQSDPCAAWAEMGASIRKRCRLSAFP